MKAKRATTAAKKDKGLLVNLARTIGSTLGTVAAKTDALTKTAPRRTARKKSATKKSKTRKKSKA